MLGEDLSYLNKCGSVWDSVFSVRKSYAEKQKTPPKPKQTYQNKTKKDPNQTNLIKVTCNVFC